METVSAHGGLVHFIFHVNSVNYCSSCEFSYNIDNNYITLQSSIYIYLIQNSQAVKKVCGPQKGYGEKRCEIQGGGQEMAVMVG